MDQSRGQKKGPTVRAGPFHALVWLGLAGGDAVRARALLALSDFEVDRLALIEGGVALGFDLRVVDKQVFSTIRRANESETLV